MYESNRVQANTSFCILRMPCGLTDLSSKERSCYRKDICCPMEPVNEHWTDEVMARWLSNQYQNHKAGSLEWNGMSPISADHDWYSAWTSFLDLHAVSQRLSAKDQSTAKNLARSVTKIISKRSINCQEFGQLVSTRRLYIWDSGSLEQYERWDHIFKKNTVVVLFFDIWRLGQTN
jgi:hypothetical protein